MFILCLLIFLKIIFFQKILSEVPLVCKIVWNQIRPHILSGSTRVQIVCKGYQLTRLVDKELNKLLRGQALLDSEGI